MKVLVCASLLAGVNALSFDAVEAKNRPVSKVINLLKDMQAQLQQEAEDDQEIYDKMACWCTTNDKEKTASIAAAEEKIAQLTANIEANTGKSATLTTEIANLEKEVAGNQQALAKATALRQKELAAFNKEEKDLLQSIQALKNAVTVLSKHHPSLVQTTDDEIAHINLASVLKHTMRVHKDLLEDAIAPEELHKVQQFIQQPAHLQGYGSQSGEIFGILKNMKDTFEENLSGSQKAETAAQASYEDLKAAKEAEIKAGQDQVDTKTNELAASDQQIADDKEDREDTQNSLSADEKFLMNLKEKCKQTDQEWDARQKTRADEISAVGEALKFLSSDDAHDMFTRTFNFVQISSSEQVRRNKAVALLMKNPKLMAIAMAVKRENFDRVFTAIDKMVADLTKQKKDEAAHRDSCIALLNENEKQNTHNTRNKADQEAQIDNLAAEIKTLATEIADLNAKIAEAEKQLKRAGEDREKANLEFQKTVQDQRATQKLLTQALNVLKSFYEKKALLQQEPAGPPPPAGFKSYENNAGGGGVVAMITQIIQDAKAMEAEAVHDEEDAQAAYESFVKETNDTNTADRRSIVSKTGTKAEKEGEKVNTEQELDSTNITLEQLANEKADLHKSCDFFMDNYEVRQNAIDEEVEALRQARSILKGAKSFLQRN